MSDHPDPDRIAARKTELRRWALEQRAAQRAEIEAISAAVQTSLQPFLQALAPGWIVLFDAMPDEVRLAGLAQSLPRRQFALTRTPPTGRRLTLHPASAPRERHRFGYSQPVADAPVVPDEDVRAVLVPGLLFDPSGGRLGFGAGFYDRFLARFPAEVARVGVASLPLANEVPVEEHDVRMTHLVGAWGLQRV